MNREQIYHQLITSEKRVNQERFSQQERNKLKLTRYAEKLTRVCDYIIHHLDDDLSVAELSQVAHFSKYHFHRQFSAFMGITVSKYILLMRLKRASYQLVYHQELRVITIALAAKFENPESFSRMFKKTYEQTPSQFRKSPQWQNWHQKMSVANAGIYNQNQNEKGKNMHVEIVEVSETKIAVLEHRGTAELLNNSISKFIEWRKSCSLSPVKTSNTYGIAYSDPNTTAPEDFRFDICGEENKSIPENPQGVIAKVIPAGRCARIRHLGSHDKMDDKIYYLYRDWLTESGEKLRDFPCYFHYINLFPEVAEHELITDIYLPLQ